MQERASTTPPTPPVLRQEGNQKRGRKVFLKSRSKCVRQNNKLKEEVGFIKGKIKIRKI